MKTLNLKLALMSACIAIALSSGMSFAKGTVTGKATLNPSAPQDCIFVVAEDTQQGCTHGACNTAVKNAIKALQAQQPNGACQAQAKSRGCKYNNCK